ncbi:Ubiquitin-related modifier 1 [Wallemia ichthyophaga EXF-994]|uniref:Ubiquitin-related modifier 1 n=1 Tax=Wallemia ichthyophaga (strain EXF-994 / CBS 113033) TaxID=1299270 RepID=R9APP6_WALI9|nr:Ubiquitin-related modifier 1 [Wallemia ichthyophaga EXF-994]EOR04187.1 Ubiquitin-related modifier 1 [Wallemia ichthyophaga EXF-994]
MSSVTRNLNVEFGGGLEILFNHQRQIKLVVSAQGRNPTVRDLIKKLADEHINERRELFIEGDTVRPGILVLINDCDWELRDELDGELEDGDVVVFISTLHGG